jgi:triacylglycerol esterase/lipase EstA (alpha/beta hydrolase family)
VLEGGFASKGEICLVGHGMGGSLSRDFPARIGGHTAGAGYGNVLGNSGYLTIRPFEGVALERAYHFDQHEKHSTSQLNDSAQHHMYLSRQSLSRRHIWHQ